MKLILSKLSEFFKLIRNTLFQLMKLSEFFQDLDGNFSSKRLLNITSASLTLTIIGKVAFAMIEAKAWEHTLYLIGGLGVFILILTNIITVENIKQIVSIVKGKE